MPERAEETEPSGVLRANPGTNPGEQPQGLPAQAAPVSDPPTKRVRIRASDALERSSNEQTASRLHPRPWPVTAVSPQRGSPHPDGEGRGLDHARARGVVGSDVDPDASRATAPSADHPPARGGGLSARVQALLARNEELMSGLAVDYESMHAELMKEDLESSSLANTSRGQQRQQLWAAHQRRSPVSESAPVLSPRGEPRNGVSAGVTAAQDEMAEDARRDTHSCVSTGVRSTWRPHAWTSSPCTKGGTAVQDEMAEDAGSTPRPVTPVTLDGCAAGQGQVYHEGRGEEGGLGGGHEEWVSPEAQRLFREEVESREEEMALARRGVSAAVREALDERRCPTHIIQPPAVLAPVCCRRGCCA